MGSPQQPSPEQYKQLQEAGQLQMIGSPHWMDVRGGAVDMETRLPRNSVLLVRVKWQ
jgi:xylan 1,4-beta-xylosidase